MKENKEKYVKVPVKWFTRLLEQVDEIKKELQPLDFRLHGLMDHIESAEYILEKNIIQ